MKTIRMLAALAVLCAAALTASAAFPDEPARFGASRVIFGGQATQDAYMEKLSGGTQLTILRLYAVESERFARVTTEWIRRDAELLKGLVDGLREKAKASKGAQASAFEAAAVALERQAKDASVSSSGRAAVAAAVKLLEAKP